MCGARTGQSKGPKTSRILGDESDEVHPAAGLQGACEVCCSPAGCLEDGWDLNPEVQLDEPTKEHLQQLLIDFRQNRKAQVYPWGKEKKSKDGVGAG